MPLHRLLFYLTILLLPTQLGRHFWPDWAMVMGRRIDYLSPTIYMTDILILLTILSYISVSSMYKTYARSLRERFIPGIKVASIPGIVRKSSAFYFLLITFVIINITFSQSPTIAIMKWMKILELVLWGLYIVKTKPSLAITTLLLILAGFYSSIIAIAQFAIERSLGGIFWWLGERTFYIDTPGIARIDTCSFLRTATCGLKLRPYATFPHPNVLAGFLSVSILLLSSLHIPKFISRGIGTMGQWDNGTRRLWIHIITFFLYVILITALILCFSRSAWIVTAAGVVFVLVKKYSFRSFKTLVPLSLVAVFFVIIGIPYMRSLASNPETIPLRGELTAAAIAMWQQSPLVGVGLGNFLVQLPKYITAHKVLSLQPVHNIYLLLLSETGIVGLTVCLCFIYIIMMQRDKGTKGQRSVILSLVALLLLGLTDHYPISLQQGQLLLTMLISFNFLTRAPKL